MINFVYRYPTLAGVFAATFSALGLIYGGQRTLAHIILIAAMLAAIVPLGWGIVQDLRAGKYGVDILALTAIITSVLLREYWAGIVIVVMLSGGEALEDYAERRAQNELKSLLDRSPSTAHLLRGRKIIDIALDNVKVGDKLVIKPGEIVPVDCIITEGESSFDESSLTGESLPVDKSVGQKLLSGSLNQNGSVVARASHSAADSQYAQIVKLVQSASRGQAPFVRMADRFAVPFTIVAFVLGGIVWAISGQAIRFLEVLVVATPCPLILGAPIALISGMSRSAKAGIIVKNGSALERLGQVKAMAFDKTGTLTEGCPVVGRVVAYGSFGRDDVVGLAAGLEQHSPHILAQAILTYATKKAVKIPKLKNIYELSGNGVSGQLKNQEVLLGNARLMEANSIVLPKKSQTNKPEQTTTFLALGGRLVGSIEFSDKARASSKAVLQRLKSLGITKQIMITGDNAYAAAHIAKQIGISEVYSECLPSDKLRIVESLKFRPLAFVGDGVNDAPVLAASDVGIALGARGETAASESADVVIMVDDIARVATSVEIAQRTFFIAKQSILIGIGLSLGLMAIFATGRFQPIHGAVLQEIVDIAVIFNALRALKS